MTGFQEERKAPMEIFFTESGLALWVPKVGDQSWDSKLPSTPYPNKDLRLRVPGDLSSGFVRGSSEAEDR